MNKAVNILLGAAVLLSACAKETEQGKTEETGAVVMDVVIAQEEASKATLGDSDGVFRFSSGDGITVYSNGATYTGTTVSTSNSGAFNMSDGFPLNHGGLVGFPSGIVTEIKASTVTFTLPNTYEFAQVGSTDPNTCKAPVPMVGKYTAPGSGNPKVTLKQAGAVVRFRLTNVKAGSVSFTFPTRVTGTVSVTPKGPGETQWGDGDGILAGNLSTSGSTIAVTEVPEVEDGSYIYITLPVPTDTVPDGIIVNNTPDDGSTYTQQNISNGASALSRASGYKIAARPVFVRDPVFEVAECKYVILAPGNLMAKLATYDSVNKTATADEWRFQGPFDFVGSGSTTGNYLFYYLQSSDCVGKWVDMFAWQGEGVTYKVHGIIRYTTSNNVRYGNADPVTTYPGCWEVYDSSKDYGEGVTSSDFITISNGGDYKWRMMANTEWNYLLTERETSTLGGTENARFARVTVGSSDGLLLFPKDIEDNWNVARMGAVPSNINFTGSVDWGGPTYNRYSTAQYARMQEVGVMFLPKSGIYYSSFNMDRGYYWTNNSSPTGLSAGSGLFAYRMSVIAESLYTTAQAHVRSIAAAVRLVRDVD